MSLPPGRASLARTSRTARVHINREALQHNLERVRFFAPGRRVIAVIKANAYGHGLLNCASGLLAADAFALATIGEALELRHAGYSKPLIVLQGFADQAELATMAQYRLQPVLHQLWQIDLLCAANTDRLDVWLKIDTGMHRLGIGPEQVTRAWQQLNQSGGVGTIRLMTHFANSDDVDNINNNKQIECFIKAISGLGAESSMANSGAITALPDSHFDWVRPGIMLYGASPLQQRTAAQLGLRAVMSLQSKLIAVQQFHFGDAVGYGGTWVCPEDMPVGVVAVGYGDGYPRHAASGTPVWINGQLCPLVGRVSMDSLCIDLRGCDAKPGDRVVLWGDELAVDLVAAHAGTIAYELLCHAGNAAGTHAAG
jgi:alanine racemase